MSTGQKYSGKGDSTTPSDQNGSSLEQTGENSPSAAKPTLFAEVFTFDELVIFNGLSDAGKTSISALVNSGHYQPDQLKRALLHIAQTPDSASPSDVFNGESLASILTDKPDLEEALKETLAHPISQISGVLTHDGRTYVRLTDYLEQVTNTEAGADAFRSELVDIIAQYLMSAKYLADTDPDKEQKVTDLHHGISLLVARVSRHKNKPVPDPSDLKPVDYLENPLQPTQLDVLMHDPASITSVEYLQEWVARLQFINSAVMEINTNLKEVSGHGRELIDVMKAKLEEYEALIPRLRAKIPAQKAPEFTPLLSHQFNIITHRRGTSQAEILFFALTEYRDSRRQQYEEGIRDGEFDGAYTDFSDAQVAQHILDELQMSAFDLASQNYMAGHYKGNDERFRSEKATEAKWHDKEYNEFLALHNALPEESESGTTPTEPAPEA